MVVAGKGYTSRRLGVLPRLKEIGSLLVQYRNGAEDRVRKGILEVTSAKAEIADVLNKPINGLDVLEIGSGQQSIQLAVMSLNNRAIGIDRESSGQDLGVGSILHMVKSDGVMRAAKTAGRKIFQFDRTIQRAFARQMAIQQWPSLDIQQMDAAKMSFADGSFDVVFSRAVFEHIADPKEVLREVARILRPGGVFYCLLHLYTSDSGCHDVRIFGDHRGNLPLWSHLREEHRQKVIENTFLNKLRLSEWRDICASVLSGANVQALMDDMTPNRASDLAEIRKDGELTCYSDEELLTVTVKVIWQRDPSDLLVHEE
jgi:SAM-dependent methyltransferase